MNQQYPIVFGTWAVMRLFSVGGWQKVKDGDELTARRAYNGHKANLGRRAVCLVRPCGTVEAMKKVGCHPGGNDAITAAVDAFDAALAGEVSPHTRRTYGVRLRRLVRDLGASQAIETLTAHDLRQWRASLVEVAARYVTHPIRPTQAGGLSPVSVQGYMRAARRFFGWLQAEGWLPQNPAAGLGKVKVPLVKPKEVEARDIARLLEAARDHPRDYALVWLLADSGARIGGLCSLQVRDVELARGCATILQKGGGLQTILFGDETRAALVRYLAEHPGGVWLFPGKQAGQPLTPQGAYLVLKRLALRAGATGRFNPHAFRHALALGMLREKSDLGTVSRVLGHSHISTTHEHYGWFTDDELAARKRQFAPRWMQEVRADGTSPAARPPHPFSLSGD
jgi:site-specific recombinase XerD